MALILDDAPCVWVVNSRKPPIVLTECRTQDGVRFLEVSKSSRTIDALFSGEGQRNRNLSRSTLFDELQQLKRDALAGLDSDVAVGEELELEAPRKPKRKRLQSDTIVTVKHHFCTDMEHNITLLSVANSTKLFVELSQCNLNLMLTAIQHQLSQNARIEKPASEIKGLMWEESAQRYRYLYKDKAGNNKWLSSYFSVASHKSKQAAHEAACEFIDSIASRSID